MKAITKATEPPSLTAHRKTPYCYYSNYRGMDELRHALVSEQRGLCCYCMGRIRNGPKDMKVEHWQCQSRYPSEQLNYKNLLGACLGGEGQPRNLQHCDTRKADTDLQWNPADPMHHIETRVGYLADGTIVSDDPKFDAQLNDLLNLNLPLFRNHRKAVLKAVLAWWSAEKKRTQRPAPRERFEQEKVRHIGGGDDDLSPYCQVAAWWLQQKLLGMRA